MVKKWFRKIASKWGVFFLNFGISLNIGSLTAVASGAGGGSSGNSKLQVHFLVLKFATDQV